MNPTLSQCFVCREDTGEIALLGAGYKGEAPMHMVTSIEPCEKCREKYLTNGTMLVEADWEKKPTGNFTIIKDEAFQKMFGQDVPKHKIAFVEEGLLQKITTNNEKN